MKNFGKILLNQVLAAKQFLGFKSPKVEKKAKSTKKAYEFGTLGVSQVSKAIKNDFGRVVSRKERKVISKRLGKPFQAYYNH